jgi:hypothetical protein
VEAARLLLLRGNLLSPSLKEPRGPLVVASDGIISSPRGRGTWEGHRALPVRPLMPLRSPVADEVAGKRCGSAKNGELPCLSAAPGMVVRAAPRDAA